ncbi:MAG TPA: AraC family transcriptional regulator [Candidatus Cryptobacteroides pullicola]|nr:AraC family transcriptional regulator [Candidatus Cryptobacteroides pullicola]
MFPKDFKFYKPCKELQPYVRYYWVFKSSRPLNTLTFPIGCPQIIFHKRTPLYIPELRTVQSEFTISGQVNYPSHLYADGNVEMIVVVFQPYSLKAFLNLPISLLHNQELSGYDLENKNLKQLAAQIFDSEDSRSCVSIIEQWLLLQITNVQTSKTAYDIERITAAMKRLSAMPATPVTELASTACLGKKQFERLFNELIGANPKEYARIVRFQKSLKLLQHYPEDANLAQMAYQCAYADQSHFIREFKRFSGHTPLALLNVCKPYSDLFSNPI